MIVCSKFYVNTSWRFRDILLKVTKLNFMAVQRGEVKGSPTSVGFILWAPCLFHVNPFNSYSDNSVWIKGWTDGSTRRRKNNHFSNIWRWCKRTPFLKTLDISVWIKVVVQPTDNLTLLSLQPCCQRGKKMEENNTKIFTTFFKLHS